MLLQFVMYYSALCCVVMSCTVLFSTYCFANQTHLKVLYDIHTFGGNENN